MLVSRINTKSHQMRANRIAKATVQMTDREREMNGNILRLLQGDKDLQAKIR